MKTHEMGLQDKWFNYIKNGTKRVELRLMDAKRKQIQPGDTIIFTSKRGEKIEAIVSELITADTFESLLNVVPVEQVSSPDYTTEQMLKIMEQFYPVEKQRKLGVVGIRIDQITPVN